jgi:hypothetical protein
MPDPRPRDGGAAADNPGLRKIAHRLVRESAGFQEFLADMGGRETPVPDPQPGRPLCEL